jgi:hypothetical protein
MELNFIKSERKLSIILIFFSSPRFLHEGVLHSSNVLRQSSRSCEFNWRACRLFRLSGLSNGNYLFNISHLMIFIYQMKQKTSFQCEIFLNIFF